MNRGKAESSKALVDITEGISIGRYVSSFFTLLAMVLSYLYGRRFKE